MWIYYPWRKHIVHCLDEEEFIRVRTIRNAYKITFEEQALLRTKKIGIIGLSVGQSVALALAMERIAGEIRIADFDTLELSNLNRIRTGISNLGLKKTKIVAREIAEIDPFIKVICFDKGINKDTIDEFFDSNEGLNLLVEECDSVEVKIYAREIAKTRRIPVIMSMSDRGMLDVERFDMSGNYQILHGLIPKNVTYEFLANLKSTQEKIPYMLPIIGTDSLSTRLKASAIEIGETITTWPQLASDVILDGAICAHTARKILLGQNIVSRRQWIDLDTLIYSQDEQKEMLWTKEGKLSSEKAIEAVGRNKALLEHSFINKIISDALLSPSPGNNQKWKFVASENSIFCFIDKNVFFSFSDNLNVGSLLAIGAAIENMKLRASDEGYETKLEVMAAELKPGKPVAQITFKKNTSIEKSELTKYINVRSTYRSIAGEKMIFSDEQVNTLKNSIGLDGSIVCSIIQDASTITKIGKMIASGDRFRFLNSKGHHEFFNEEIRWNTQEAELAGDGLDITNFPLTELDKAGLSLSKSSEAIALVKHLKGGRAFENISRQSFESADAIAIISIDKWSSASLIEAGQTIQKFWLTAESLNIGIQPMTILQSLFTFRKANEFNFVTDVEIQFIDRLHHNFHEACDLDINLESVFLCRLKNKTILGSKSFRIAIDQKLTVI